MVASLGNNSDLSELNRIRVQNISKLFLIKIFKITEGLK